LSHGYNKLKVIEEKGRIYAAEEGLEPADIRWEQLGHGGYGLMRLRLFTCQFTPRFPQ